MDDEWVTIIHPETGGTGEVHQSSLPQHYASGWRLLAPDEVPDPDPEPNPPPMTRAKAAKAEKAASSENKEN
jgi:hypothetical protein